MKTQIEKLANRLVLAFLTSLVAVALVEGCAVPKPSPMPNPLEGWQFSNQNPNETIEKDYRDYIQKLPSEERKCVGTVHFFADGVGQHAINIEIGINGTWWEHVLIYDKENKRIKVIKYPNGRYSS